MEAKVIFYFTLHYEGLVVYSLTDKNSLREHFKKTNFNDVKETDYPLFSGLFDKFLTRPNFSGTVI